MRSPQAHSRFKRAPPRYSPVVSHFGRISTDPMTALGSAALVPNFGFRLHPCLSPSTRPVLKRLSSHGNQSVSYPSRDQWSLRPSPEAVALHLSFTSSRISPWPIHDARQRSHHPVAHRWRPLSIYCFYHVLMYCAVLFIFTTLYSHLQAVFQQIKRRSQRTRHCHFADLSALATPRGPGSQLLVTRSMANVFSPRSAIC